MNTRSTVILGIVALLAVGYFWYESTHNIPTDEWLQKTKKLFPDMKSDQATRLEVTKDGTTIVCEKSDDKWRLTEPRAVRAEKSEIDSILSGFEFLEKEGVVSAEQGRKVEPASYGFDKPQVQATFWLRETRPTMPTKDAKKADAKKEPEGRKFELTVGAKAAVGKNVYVMVAGQPDIFVVGDSILEKLSKGLNDLRDKTVVEIEKPDVEKIELSYASGQVIECAKDKSGWKEVRPVADLADKDKVEGVLDKLRDLRIEKDDFIAEEDKDLSKYGLDKPQITAVVYQKGAAKTVLLGKKVEGKTDKIYAKRKEEPAVFALKDSTIADLTKDPNDLRDKRVCRLDPTDDATKIEIVQGKVEVVLEKKDADWKIVKPAEEKADQSTTKDFLDALDKLETEGWAADKATDLAKYGLAEPASTITVTLKDDKGVRKVLLGKKDEKGQHLYAKRDISDPILLVKSDFERHLAAPPIAFRDKLVLEFSKMDSKSLTVKRQDKTFAAKDAGDNKWELDQPIKAAADKSAVDDILYDLSYLRAKRYVAELPADLKKYGLDAPRITATVEFDQEVKVEKKADAPKDQKDDKAKAEEKKPEKKRVSKTLLVGNDDEDKNAYAKLADGNTVFTVDAPVLRHLQGELASRDMMKFKKEDATRITLTYPGLEVVVEKKGNDWMVTKPAQKPLNTSDADDILNTMCELRGDTVAAYAAPKPEQFGLEKPVLKIAIGLPEGEKALTIGKEKDADSYFAKAGASEFVCVLPKSTVDKLMKEKPAAPKPAEPPKKSEMPAPAAPPAATPAKAPPAAKTPAEILSPAAQPAK